MSEGQNQFHISGIQRRFDSYLSHPQFGREEFDIAAVPKYISFYEKVVLDCSNSLRSSILNLSELWKSINSYTVHLKFKFTGKVMISLS